MGVGIVLAGIVVAVLVDRCVGGETLKPLLKVGVQTVLVVVDEDARGDVHGVDEAETFRDAAVGEGLLDLGGDVDKAPAAGHVEPEFLPVGLHLDASNRERIRIRRIDPAS